MVRRALLVAAVLGLVAACAAAVPMPVPSTRPALTCDARMIDHNRRACTERETREHRAMTFIEPAAGSSSCGHCVLTVPPMPEGTR